jgi:hypothetical protein
MRMTLADRRRRQRSKKARDRRNGIVPPPVKWALNKAPIGGTSSPATAQPVRSSVAARPATTPAPVNDQLTRDLARPVSELSQFTRPVLASLARAGITTVGAAKAYTEEQFARIEGVGPKTVDKIRSGLRGLGLGFAETGAPALAA